MRILFSDLGRPKAATKYLARLSAQLKLSSTQEALARAAGYRDWHDLTANVQPGQTWPQFSNSVATVPVILALADELGLTAGDVQFALTKARLFGTAWSLENQLEACSSIWRQRVLGPPGRGKPGTVVKVRVSGLPARPAYLRLAGRPSWVVYDTGPGTCADFEVVTPRTPLADFVPTRLWLPYGYWTLKDGSQVVFSRDYLPMWRVTLAAVDRLEPWYWINGIAGEFHFAGSGAGRWSSGPAREQALAHLKKHRIAGLPRLVDIMPHLLEPDIERISEGVARLHERHGNDLLPPAYARLSERYASR
jgi:hypothetical protein